MSASITFQTVMSGQVNTGGIKTISNDAAEIVSPGTVLAAQAGTLSTRTGPTSGTLTMTSASHGIVTGQRIDLYWEGSSCFGITVGTVSGTSVPFTAVQGGAALPPPGTAIIAGICKSVAFTLNGNGITALACSRATANVRCYFVFVELLNVLALAVLNQSQQVYSWNDPNVNGSGPIGSAGWQVGPSNPLAGTNPVIVYISHADTAAADSGLIAAALKS